MVSCGKFLIFHSSPSRTWEIFDFPRSDELLQLALNQFELSGFELYSLRASKVLDFWHFVLCCAYCATLAEQLCLPRWKASFPTRLRFVICAAVRFANCDARGENLSFSTEKAKRQSPERATAFLAEKERFELSRRYNRPTPLAGAPLHHLSISPLIKAKISYEQAVVR